MEQMDKKPQRIEKEAIVEELRQKMREHSFTLLTDYKEPQRRRARHGLSPQDAGSRF